MGVLGGGHTSTCPEAWGEPGGEPDNMLDGIDVPGAIVLSD